MNNKILNLVTRYIILILLGLGNLWLFYKIFTPLTVNFSAYVLKLFSSVIILGDIIIFKSIAIQLIPACIAGSAYYLLIILILSTPDIKINRRLLLIVASLATLFVLNNIRIVLMALLVGSNYFQSIHLIFWYIVSTLFVVIIWFVAIYLFKIKSVPIYSDLKFLIKCTKKNAK